MTTLKDLNAHDQAILYQFNREKYEELLIKDLMEINRDNLNMMQMKEVKSNDSQNIYYERNKDKIKEYQKVYYHNIYKPIKQNQYRSKTNNNNVEVYTIDYILENYKNNSINFFDLTKEQKTFLRINHRNIYAVIYYHRFDKADILSDNELNFINTIVFLHSHDKHSHLLNHSYLNKAQIKYLRKHHLNVYSYLINNKYKNK